MILRKVAWVDHLRELALHLVLVPYFKHLNLAETIFIVLDGASYFENGRVPHQHASISLNDSGIALLRAFEEQFLIMNCFLRLFFDAGHHFHVQC